MLPVYIQHTAIIKEAVMRKLNIVPIVIEDPTREVFVELLKQV